MRMVRNVALVLAATALAPVVGEETADKPAEGADEALPAVQAQPQEKFFHMLPLCRRFEGVAEVLRPGAREWEAIEEGRFYPFGCAYRTTLATSRLTLQFGTESSVEVEGVASFATKTQEVGGKSRTIILQSGTVKVILPRNLPSGIFKIAAPGFSIVEASGESLLTFNSTGDGDEATIRCITGTLAIEGRHFKIPAMRAANEVRIRTSQDILFTALYGTSGDYDVTLDQGLQIIHDFETGEDKQDSHPLKWKLSPKKAVRIHRAKPAIGERLAVTVMTFDENGSLVNRCAFAEGRAEINTGEQGELAIAAKEEAAKKAVDSADTSTTTEAAEEESTTTEATTATETKEESTTEE